MKKLLLAIAVAIVSIAASAQTAKMFNWGVEAGMNFNSLSFDKEMFESGNRAGFFVGPKVKVKVPLVGLGLDGALLYSMNSANMHNTLTDNVKSKNLSYLEIPLNVRYDFSLLKVLSIYLATGPQYNYCMSSDATIAEFYGPVDGGISRSTWGWNVGGGVELFKHLQLGVTYTIPISDSGSFELSDVANVFTNYKQKTVKLRLAYFF
jgi:opacity protein-like surface antigen